MSLTRSRTERTLNSHLLEKQEVEKRKTWDILFDLESILKINLDARKETVLNIYDRRAKALKQIERNQERAKKNNPELQQNIY